MIECMLLYNCQKEDKDMTTKTMVQGYKEKFKKKSKGTRWVFRHEAICTVHDMVTYGFITQGEADEIFRRMKE